jgi:hypothetical protein
MAIIMTNLPLIALLVTMTLALIFLPTAIAYWRHHPDRALLAKLNIVAILSMLLWLALLVWAAGGTRNDAVINRFVHSKKHRPLLIGLLAVLVGGGVATTAFALGVIRP